MVCLDSDIIISFLRKDQKTIQLLEELRDEEELSTTSINSFELLKGIPTDSKIDKENVKGILSNFKIYNFEFESAEKAAEIFDNLKSKGEQIDLADILIASIAITNDETLVTKNLNHFERIKGLKLKKLE
ncbi:type II toxin-antitoxin system VapC family toxin [Candidatus Pacearchaeota archaeon]|nr:type II toxin-antitoxin system VapC family toxin [Candidatus Pacearchaeota archaeon]